MSKLVISKIKSVMVCEDHPFIQLGIEVALREILPQISSFEVVSSGEQALKMASGKRLELAFVDLGLPDMSGVTVVEKLKQLTPSTKFFVVTSCDNPATLKQVHKLGVAAIIQKSSSGEHFKTALANLEAPNAGTYLDHYTQSLLSEHVEIDFTAKENEVLSEIIQGRSNQQIADFLGCAVTTVRFHRANIMEKTGMRNAAELTAWVLQGQRKRD